MKISTLIEQLKTQQELHGDVDVHFDDDFYSQVTGVEYLPEGLDFFEFPETLCIRGTAFYGKEKS